VAKSIHKAQKRLETFARQYVILRFNGKQAAIAAGYSPKSAEFQASALLKNPKVKRLIETLTAAQNKKHDFSVERTMEEIARCAFIDPRALFRADGSLKPIQELEPDIAACIAGVEQTGKRTKRVKLTDKLRALDMLGRYHKIFAEDRTPIDMGVRVIILDAPRPVRQVGSGAAALPPANGNGSGPHDD
jgi:phage terminase small subunit